MINKSGRIYPCKNDSCKNYRIFEIRLALTEKKGTHSIYSGPALNRDESDVIPTVEFIFFTILTCMACVHFERHLDVSKILDETVRV